MRSRTTNSITRGKNLICRCIVSDKRGVKARDVFESLTRHMGTLDGGVKVHSGKLSNPLPQLTTQGNISPDKFDYDYIYHSKGGSLVVLESLLV